MIATLKTYSPVDNSLYVEREYANQEEIKTVLSKAQVAKKLWSLSSLAERQEYCLAAVNEIVASKVDIAEEICWQMGRPIRYAAGEINGFEERARYMIAQAESSLASVELPEKRIYKIHQTRAVRTCVGYSAMELPLSHSSQCDYSCTYGG